MSGAYNTPSLNAGSSNVKESHTRKIQKTSALDLLIDPRNFHYMRMPACMQLAIDYAKPILLSKRFREVLISLIPNCDSSKLDKALQEAKIRGFAEIHLRTAAVLVEAIRLYESIGFVRTSNVPVTKNCNLAMTKQLA